MKAVHTIISGRVQGVSFRAWTADVARELGLIGWVRNLPDGTVEAVFSGEEAVIAEMLKRLREGPPAARVDHVADSAWTEQVGRAFEVRPDA